MLIDPVLILLAGALVAATLLPLVQTPLWWVRALEFPRFQIAGGLVAVLAAAVLRGGVAGWVAALACAGGLALQLRDIRPFTPLSPREMRRASRQPGTGDVRFLAMNVLLENPDHARVAAEIARIDADVVFLMEVDAAWHADLQPALSKYHTVLFQPHDNHYGLIFATRLHVRNAKVVYLSVEDTPAVLAEMEAPGGEPFRFVGLHPIPPVPGEDTEGRDAEVAYAARFARETRLPVIAMGDFNTAAWSRIAHRFKVVGGYLDPRVGRGPLPSFDANRWWLRFPIDQFYATEEVALVDFRRGRHVGSDHFPIIAEVRMDRALAARLNRKVTALPDAEEDRILRAIEFQGGRLKHVTRRASPAATPAPAPTDRPADPPAPATAAAGPSAISQEPPP